MRGVQSRDGTTHIPVFARAILNVVENAHGHGSRGRKAERAALALLEDWMRTWQVLIAHLREAFDLSVAFARAETRLTVVLFPELASVFDQSVVELANIIDVRQVSRWHWIGPRRTYGTAERWIVDGR